MLAVLALVLTHAHVLTLSPAQPTVSTLAIVDGRVAYAGDDETAARRAAGPAAHELDLGGRTVMPGFNDAHVHFGYSITAYGSRGIFLHQAVTKKELIAATLQLARDRPDKGWLFVTVPDMPDGIRRAADLDFLPRPLFVITERGGLLNTRALQKANIPHDEAPDGVVRGRLMNSVLEHIVTLQPRQELIEGARTFLAELARVGITSVQLIDELPEIFEELRRDDQLTARVRLIPFGYRWNDATYHLDWKGGDARWVNVDGVKYFHDSWASLPRFELQRVFDAVTAARRHVVVHVLGKHALSRLLDSIERLSAGKPEAARLFRFDHVDEASPVEAARIAKLGIMVCSNPAMIPEWHQWHADNAFPMRTLLNAGVKLCIGTDWLGDHLPRRELAPLSSLQLAVTRNGAPSAEKISVAEALSAYTVGSATAEDEALDKGMLAPGMLADLIVLSADPLATPPDHLGEIEVLLTMVGGRVVHRRGGFGAPPPTTIGKPTPPTTTIGPIRPSPTAPRKQKH
jgi:predicted amidohydrolase YtcJ